MRSFTVSSISTSEPLIINKVKDHLRIQTTAEDMLVAGYIRAARIQCENMIRRALIPTSFLLALDAFTDEIILPRGNPLSATAADLVITYTDSSGNTATCASTNYTVDPNSEPARLYLAYNASWPTNIRNIEGTIRIAYKAGYTTATVPENAKLWIMQRAGAFYEHREPIYEGRPLSYIGRTFVDGLLDDLRIII